MNALFDLKKIGKFYPPHLWALQDIHLTIQKGDWLSLCGPSGSGKTTLLNILAGLDRQTSGEILFKNELLNQYSEEELSHFRRDHLGILFQTHYLIPHLTALENVMLAQYFHSLTDKDEARSLLVAVGLETRIHHLPKELSGGERQRVCLARALINQPEILLCDEPTANLDEENKNTVMKLLRQLHQQGMTIVMVTHDPSVNALATRHSLLRHGQLVN